ncbi:MAG: hypothetical protein K8R36_08750 [Planctomycetales bacterium]|nr:hypothetical protein [Planctomycetales bacterium]
MPDEQWRCFRITEEDIDEVRGRWVEPHLIDDFARMIDAYTRWVEIFSPRVDEVIDQITVAFAGVELGDGIGLWEAQGLDDYASDDKRRELRSKDETKDWRRISPEVLERCYSSPSFFDPKGFVFHLPAFLIAELNDQYSYGFIDRLIDTDRPPDGWPKLLTSLQREAVISTLFLVAEHPDYADKRESINAAVEYFRSLERGQLESRL